MRKTGFCFFIFLLPVILSAQNRGPASGQPSWQKLYIIKDKRFISQGADKVFFWMGDTAWELFHRLTREEVEYYLKNRAEKGFNVIHASAIAEFSGLTQPNAYGQLPLINNDPAQPNEEYFKHLDFVLDRAAHYNMFIALLPTWGDKFNKKWGEGPEIFTPENARRYGEFLGKRYQAKNVIWMLGGDRNPENEQQYLVVRAMAEGLTAGHGGARLTTYYPTGDSNSSAFFHQDSWQNINMFQSGQESRDKKNYVMMRQNHYLFPVKPSLDGGPRYEDGPVNWKPSIGYFTDFDARQAAWWSVMSGACGHTYGSHNVWQFFDPDRNPPISYARTHWKRALDLPGAFQMGYLRKLMDSHPWWRLMPEQRAIKNANPEDQGYQMASLSEDMNFLFAYTPAGRPLRIDLSMLTAAPRLVAYWYNPRDGMSIRIGEVKNEGVVEFKPYASGPGTDWVLVLDDVTKPWAGFGLKK
ncbi:glycoside hydrolase family 140 protein [Arundinibacter roseus]|uniref:glycoside hydrolase family 140 protein n=1 Tax=Arundinibacter roseus TaxID=2070510 RepID=UPI0018FEC177|nr:glycoside hydrolase family 140 protein [Arundinibacter roseus]